jgi:arsenical pump membrane protein
VVPRALAETVAFLLLATTLAFAVVRPRGLPEALVAVPAALLTVLLGILPAPEALAERRGLGPTLGFLAAVLLLAELCDREGVFEAAGQRMAAGARGRPVALLGLVFVTGSAITAVLSLDATVVLLTPVVFATALRLRLRPKPHVYACTHLANTASLLLPVSNLTNLLAFRASGLSFARFGATMALPWLVAIAVEWLVLRRFFASDLAGRGVSTGVPTGGLPRYPVAVLGLTLAGFGLASPAGVDPALVAALGAGALAVPFLAFVAALGVVVRGPPRAGSAGWSSGWRRLLRERDADPPVAEFLRLWSGWSRAPGRGAWTLLGRWSPPTLTSPCCTWPRPRSRRPRGWVPSPMRPRASCWPPPRRAWGAQRARSGAGAGSSGWWSRPPRASTCWCWAATATAPGSARPAWDRQPASWSTTPPARSCWSGPTRPLRSTASPVRHTHHRQRGHEAASARDPSINTW